MDFALEIFDTLFFDKAYVTVFPARDTKNTISALARDNCFRQILSLFFITYVFGTLLYLGSASISYYFFYNHELEKHPKFLKNQVAREISTSLRSMPLMSLLTVPWFLAEVRGHSRMYSRPADYGGWGYIVFSIPFFILFTDSLIYLIHRWLHWPAVYKRLHKPHHIWVIPTPFASHAFHPVDGYLQSLPYHLFTFLFPLNKFVYLGLFCFVNFWTVMIHDGEYLSNNSMINGAAHHTEHHLFFKYNFGQFTTLWDRIGGSYRKPSADYFDLKKKHSMETWKQQTQEYEKLAKQIGN